MAQFTDIDNGEKVHRFSETPQGTFVKASDSNNIWLRAKFSWVSLEEGYQLTDEFSDTAIRGVIVTKFTVTA